MTTSLAPAELSATPRLQLLLAVGPAGAGRKRWFWRTRVLGLGQRPSAAEAPLALSNGMPKFIEGEAGREALTSALGASCLAGMVAEVPKALAGPMGAFMHLALAVQLRERGDKAGALAVEQALVIQRRQGKGRIAKA